MSNFIRTEDPIVASELRANSFTELPKEGNMFVFLNNGKEVFSAEEKKKMVFSNKLNF